MSFDIGKFYRQLSNKIRNTSANPDSSNNTENKKSAKSNFLFNNFNYRPTVLSDTPDDAPVMKYAVPSPEPTPAPTRPFEPLKYAVPDPTPEPTPAPTRPFEPLKYAVPDPTPEPTSDVTTATQTDTAQDSNPFESAFTKFLKGLFK